MNISVKLNLSLLVGFVVLIVVDSANNNDVSNTSSTSPYPPFTDKEIAAIKQFREKVSPYLYQSYMKRDQYLIRWIRDSNFNLDSAKEKLLQMIKWRKDNNIDTLVKEDFTSFIRTCPYSIKGHDKSGRPLLTLGIAKCDIRKLSLSGDIQKFERFMAFLIETCAETVRQLVNSGKDVRDGIIIIDANGFNLRQHGCLRCVPALLKTLNYYESYYPEYLHRFYFINVPRVAVPILDILIPAFSPKTRSIFKAFNYDRAEWESEVRKLFDPNELTYQFGGNKNSQAL